MRPQQNRRINRRNNNGSRRSPNPLTRNYDSSGPEVKIRGNAQHIADKYITLARDAQASGDRIMSENYLQHAEHYTRIILSAQPADKDHRSSHRNENDGKKPDEAQSSNNEDPATQEQPEIEGVPGEIALSDKHANAGSNDNDDSGSEDAKAERSRPKRRLPARRSSPNSRRTSSRRKTDAEEGDETSTETKPAARKPRAPRKPKAEISEAVEKTEPVLAAEQDGDDKPVKPVRTRKPRRTAKTEEASTADTEQADLG